MRDSVNDGQGRKSSSERFDCRLCHGKLHNVFSLSPAPIANSYPAKPDSGAERFSLDLMACVDCGHIQQRLVIDGLFEDYKYQTPAIISRYLEPGAKAIADEFAGGRVLEIGCNNGVFLDVLERYGLQPVGVDPAATHQLAIRGYFNRKLAQSLGEFDVVVANNVLAHIDDLDDVFDAIGSCLSPAGKLIFEVQYLPDMIASGSFDMIYHEHLDYHTLGPLAGFMERHGLVMTAWEHLENHGGSIRVTGRKIGVPCEIPMENLDWQAFRERIDAAGKRLHERLGAGKVQAFGAAAKAAILISEFGLEDKIECVLDDTPQKQGRYIPGTDIRILPVSSIHDGPVLMTAWNYEKEIRERIPNPLIHPFR
jgi:SAM-dependent methyltransferase